MSSWKRTLVAAALIAGAFMVASPAAAGTPDYKLKIAKQPDGPYSGVVTVNLDEDESRNVYAKARYTGNQSGKKDVSLVRFSEGPVSGKYFKGDQNITSDVQLGGYEFRLRRGHPKTFRVKVTSTNPGMAYLTLGLESAQGVSTACIAVNDSDC